MNQHEPRVKYFPISFFAIVMGLTGYTIAWQRAEVIYGISTPVSLFFLGLTVLVFLLILATYTVKLIRFPQAVLAELRHPVKINFFPAISISLILLSIAFLPAFEGLSYFLWVTGTGLHLILTLYVISVWIQQQYFKIEHMNPAWFIPLVGNILVPIGGVPHGFVEISWFFFSIGLIFWLVLKAIVFYRVIFHHPIPPKLVPTFFILIAPPTIGYISYVHLTGGEVDGVARILYYFGLFMALMLATQFLLFTRLQFALSWWAYSFPTAAITIATMSMYHYLELTGLRILGIVLLIILSAIIAILIGKTGLGIKRKGICVQEE